MRNLKRTLSLALAAVMLMGMMVIGAGAASSDFTDASDITNVEAVDVMVALGILEGGDKGDFQPNSILTREQAAKIICYLLLGPETAKKLSTTGVTFTDVAADRWSAPYIAYCVNLGILAGDGNGKFLPEAQLDGASFAKMLLVALGYDAGVEKYVGSDWMINVATDALEAGIVPQGMVMTEKVSRQDAAQMALETLQADVVEYENKGSAVDLGNGIVIYPSASKAKPVTSTQDWAKNISNDGIDDPEDVNANNPYTVQFGEKYFKDLTLKTGDKDTFGHPAKVWTVKEDGKTVATVYGTETPTYSYNGGKFADFKKTAENDGYTWNGAKVVRNGGTENDVANYDGDEYGDGVQIDIYTKGDNVTKIVMTFNYLGVVTNIVKDDTKTVADERKLTVKYTNDGGEKSIELNPKDTKGFDAIYDSAVKNETYLFVAPEKDNSGATKALSVSAPETVTGTIKSYTSETTVKTFSLDGTSYTMAHNAYNANGYDATEITGNLGKEVTLYTDANGAVYKIESESVATGNYVTIIDALATVDTVIGEGTTPSVQVKAILSDGTMEVYDLVLEKDKDTKHYSIKGIDSSEIFTGSENATAVTSAVKNKLGLGDGDYGMIFGYSLSGTKLTLSEVDLMTGSEADGDKDVTVLAGNKTDIKNGSTSFTSKVGNKPVLLNSNTTFVLYDSEEKTVKTVTGNKALGDTVIGADAKFGAVVSFNSDNDIYTAKVVFADVAYDDGTTEVDEYVYLDEDKLSISKDDEGNTVNSYTVITADGEELVLTSDEDDLTTGVYTYNSDNTVASADKVADEFVKSGEVTVLGSLIKVEGAGTYNVTDDTKTVSVADDANLEDTATVTVVLSENKDGTAGSDAVVIFVTKAAE